MIKLRQHQVDAITGVDAAIMQGSKNTLLVLPTGAGKTIVKAEFARRAQSRGEVCIVFAHRDVLLEQISKAMCQMGIYHTFIAASTTIKQITDMQMEIFGKHFYIEGSSVILASVDTFWRRDTTYLASLCKWWLMDEAHHCLKKSKWGRCIEKLTTAFGVGVTATPKRADKKGLGRDYDGVFDYLVEPPDSRTGDLIRKGMLSLYQIFCPPDRVDTTGVNKTSSGDWNRDKLAEKTDRSDITGDAIEQYRAHADGKQAICFTVNIAHGEHVAKQFRDAGISAINLSSEDTTSYRTKMIGKFKKGEIKVLVNCDLFGEGFDVPAVECVIMLRKTESFSLFKQQFGRALRIFEGKIRGIIIDHVGNIARHCIYGDPHDDPEWSLEPDTKRKSNKTPDPKPARICPKCFAYYLPKAVHNYECPECRHVETKSEEADALKKLQGNKVNLVEYEVDFVNTLLREREKVNESPNVIKSKMQYAGAPPVVYNSAATNQTKRLNAQTILRYNIQDWCETWAFNEGYDVQATQMQFQIVFGVNFLRAQTLGEREALDLNNRIVAYEFT